MAVNAEEWTKLSEEAVNVPSTPRLTPHTDTSRSETTKAQTSHPSFEKHKMLLKPCQEKNT